SDDGTTLTGTVTVQLMEGTDSNNLSPVYTIATGYDASKGSVSFVPPTNLYGSSNYAVRVTSSVSGPHYSHFFEAGNPDITESPSSAITVSRTSASTDSAEASTGSETASTSADDTSSSNDTSSSSDSETSTNEEKEVSDAHSDEDESSEAGSEDESEEPSSEDDVSGLDESSDEPSKDTETHTSGASTLSRPAAHGRAHSRSRSPSKNEGHGREQRKHRDRGRRPDGVSAITQDDYFRLNSAFRLWLHKEKDRYFDEMTTVKARKHFGSFVRAWNSGRLRSRYYSQDAGLGALPKRDVTRYSWKFAAKLDGRDQLEEAVEEVHKSNAPRSGGGERRPAAESSAQPPRQGPTMPSLEERPAASGRVFDEEQRNRDRRRRKREQREAREREQLVLDE
ncbi:hypothetical protein GGH99_007787, partial [Coemansia sp. RSA 1285]